MNKLSALDLEWKDVRTVGLPECDGVTVYVGENEAGYIGCFNEISGDACVMATPESYESIMSCLRYWRVQDRPYPASPASAQVGEVIWARPDPDYGDGTWNGHIEYSAKPKDPMFWRKFTAQPQADADPAGDNPWHDKPKADSTEAPEVSDDKTDHEWVEFCRPFVYMNGSHEMPNYPGICRAVLALRPKAQPLTDEQIELLWAFEWRGDRVAFIRAIEAKHGIASSTKEVNGNG